MQRVWKHSRRETPGPLRTVNWWICLSRTPPLMLLCGFPEESLIHCWFGLLLCCVSASEQCVKTGYLPRSVGERTGQAPDGLDKHHVTSQPIFPPSVSLSSLFDSLCIYLFNLYSLFFSLSLFHVYPPFLSLPLLFSSALFSFVSLTSNIMSICEKRLKRVLFCCHPHPCLLLWVTKELWIPWFGHYFMERVINETIRVFSSLCVLFEINK